MTPPDIEEVRQRALDEALQWFKELREERERQAIANGFSSAKEEEEAAMAEYTQRMDNYEKWVEEQCELLGKTREEIEAPIWKGQEVIVPETDVVLCDCEEHTFPHFCPKRLVDFRSQDMPEVAEALGYERQGRIEELRIKPGDVSRRLPDAMLEKYWAMPDTQERPPELPPWAKQDEFLQQIAKGYVSESPRSASTLSRSDGHSVGWTAQASTTTSMSETKNSEKGHPNDTIEAGTELQLPSPAKQFSPAVPAQANRKPFRSIKSMNVRRELTSITKTNKAPRRHVMQTRSQRASKFWKLDSRGDSIMNWDLRRQR